MQANADGVACDLSCLLLRRIDEVHTLVGAGAVGRGGGGGGGLDISNLIKPALARGELQCIGATTLDEHRKHIEKDQALERWVGDRLCRIALYLQQGQACTLRCEAACFTQVQSSQQLRYGVHRRALNCHLSCLCSAVHKHLLTFVAVCADIPCVQALPACVCA